MNSTGIKAGAYTLLLLMIAVLGYFVGGINGRDQQTAVRNVDISSLNGADEMITDPGEVIDNFTSENPEMEIGNATPDQSANGSANVSEGGIFDIPAAPENGDVTE